MRESEKERERVKEWDVDGCIETDREISREIILKREVYVYRELPIY